MTPVSFSASDHDHSLCQTEALDIAEQECVRHGVRLTEGRRKVLQVLWSDHQPISAYEILARLNATARQADPQARPLAPPVVYRALEFLIKNGLAHKLNSLNAYVGCAHPGRRHGAQFFICRCCGGVVELRDDVIGQDIERVAKRLGFTVQVPVVEVEGVCASCQASSQVDAI